MCTSAIANGGTNGMSEFEVPRQKIGMEMSFKNKLNFRAIDFCSVDVLLNITCGVNNNCPLSCFIDDEVRRLGETVEIELLTQQCVR